MQGRDRSRTDAEPTEGTSTLDGEPTATYPVVASPSRGSRFLMLRPLARGGIGQVGVGLGSELNREVALEEFQPELADDPGSRARFLLEEALAIYSEGPRARRVARWVRRRG